MTYDNRCPYCNNHSFYYLGQGHLYKCGFKIYFPKLYNSNNISNIYTLVNDYSNFEIISFCSFQLDIGTP